MGIRIKLLLALIRASMVLQLGCGKSLHRNSEIAQLDSGIDQWLEHYEISG